MRRQTPLPDLSGVADSFYWSQPVLLFKPSVAIDQSHNSSAQIYFERPSERLTTGRITIGNEERLIIESATYPTDDLNRTFDPFQYLPNLNIV